MQLNNQVASITNKAELAEFISKLKTHATEHPTDWINISLVDFLDALSGWVDDMDGYYLNNQLPVPEQPTWMTIAEMLLAAKSYE